jgi:hypothetical protein
MKRFASPLLALSLFVAGAVSPLACAPVFAQEDQGSASDPAPTTVTPVPTRSFALDYVIVGGLVVAVLFAVCRSGQRH